MNVIKMALRFQFGIAMFALFVFLFCLEEVRAEGHGEETTLDMVQGHWESECTRGFHYVTEAFEVNDTSYQRRKNYFVDRSSCLQLGMVQEIEGTFTIHGPSIQAPWASAIDLRPSKMFFTFLNQDQLDRTPGFCGIQDWVVNVRRDVTGTECDEGMLFDLIRVSVTTNTILLGQKTSVFDKSSPATRPITLDANSIFLKK